MIFLCYHTDSEPSIDIANRYWATDENGKYIESSTSLFPFTGASHSSQQTKILSKIATAFNLKNRCKHCQKPQQIVSRTSHTTAYAYACEECKNSIREYQNKIEEEKSSIEKEKINNYINSLVSRNKNLTTDYQLIEDDLALIILAFNRSLGNQFFKVSFMQKHCINIAPTKSWSYITRLCEAGVLTIDPERSANGAYYFKDDQLWRNNDLIAYKAVPDKSIDSDQDIINILQNRSFDQNAAIKSLWIDYATSDCMSYLFNFSSLHGLETTEDEDQEIENILRSALSIYSVANLWSAIWKIVKDAAALSTRDYYNKRKAAGTLPGKLKRHLEDVSKGKRSLGEWKRPQDQTSGSLGEIFYEFWMLDENTAGTELNKIFPISSDNINLDEIFLNREMVTEILRQAVEKDLAPEILTIFATAIEEGKSLMDALEDSSSII